jgi:anti-sigma B factor antagonist
MPPSERSESDGAGEAREHPVRAVDRKDEGVVVVLAGELDLYNADVVRETLLECCAEEPGRLVIDLGGVEFVDSTALGVLVEARARMSNPEAFALAAPGLEARRALEVSGLDRHFRVHESVGDALSSPL